MSQHKKKPHFQLEKEFLDTQELKGGPLEGIVVIDVCRAVAGPNCTKLLLDLGCRVIKCEKVGSDSLRLDRPYYAQMNGGKESIKIDFKNAYNTIRRDVVLKLVKKKLPSMLFTKNTSHF